jgi:hypothetical protein
VVKRPKNKEFEGSYVIQPPWMPDPIPGLAPERQLKGWKWANTRDDLERAETRAADWTSHLANKYKYFIDIHNPTLKKSIRFKAFITQFEDQFDAGYEDEFLGGDIEPHKRMTSMVRKINLGWDIVAVDVTDAKRNLQRISALVQMMYPKKLEVKNNVTKASEWLHVTGAQPIFKIRFFNLIGNPGLSHGPASHTGLLGHIDNLSYDIQINSGFFREKESVYPQFVKLSCTFWPQNVTPLSKDNEADDPVAFDGFPYGLTGKTAK